MRLASHKLPIETKFIKREEIVETAEEAAEIMGEYTPDETAEEAAEIIQEGDNG